MKYPRSWKTRGNAHFSTCLHHPVSTSGGRTPFSLDLSVYAVPPSGAHRRIVHTFTELAKAELFVAELTRHVETWRAGLAAEGAEPDRCPYLASMGRRCALPKGHTGACSTIVAEKPAEVTS